MDFSRILYASDFFVAGKYLIFRSMNNKKGWIITKSISSLILKTIIWFRFFCDPFLVKFV